MTTASSKISAPLHLHTPKVRLRIMPVTLRDARKFVARYHRHLDAPQGGKFAVAVADARGRVRGVAISSRPVARHLDDGRTLEVCRVATDGMPNACSALYGAVRRAAKALGYYRLVTYTLQREPGASLRAAGWRSVATTRAETWHRRRRPRRAAGIHTKQRWEIQLR